MQCTILNFGNHALYNLNLKSHCLQLSDKYSTSHSLMTITFFDDYGYQRMQTITNKVTV